MPAARLPRDVSDLDVLIGDHELTAEWVGRTDRTRAASNIP